MEKAGVHKKTQSALTSGNRNNDFSTTSPPRANTVVYPPKLESSSTNSVPRVRMYSRHMNESSEQNFANTFGGARPKQESKLGDHVDDLPGLSSCDNDTKSDKGAAYYDCKMGEIAIYVRFAVEKIRHTHNTYVTVKCDRDGYLKWKYVISSVREIYKLNERLRRSKFADHSYKSQLLPDCKAEVYYENESLVIGFAVNNKEHAGQIAKNALQSVSNDQDIMVETCVLSDTQREKALAKMKKMIDSKYVYVETMDCKPYIVCQVSYKEQVQPVLSEFKICAGEFTESERDDTQYPIRNNTHSRFIAKSGVLKKIEQELHVRFSLQKKYLIEIKGQSKEVKQAYDRLEEIEKSLCSDSVVVSKQQAVSYFKTDSSNEYMASIGRSHDVLAEKDSVYSDGEIKITKQSYDENIVWTDCHGKRLVLEQNTFEKVQGSVRVKPVLDTPAGRAFVEGGNIVLMRVPDLIHSKQSEDPDLKSEMTELLTKVSERNETCVALYLVPVGNWTFYEYMICIVNTSVHWFLNRSTNRQPSSILLFTENQGYLWNTDVYIEQRILDVLKENKSGDQRPEIRLVKKRLDQTEADVLVNTTSPNLDLSYGNVSGALLKAAGPDIQEECRTKYPKGITQENLAVTDGYNLRCNKVFHITLPLYKGFPDTMQGIQNLRGAMMICLESASDNNHVTIAFPAIGTGTLGYPTDIVISEMFGSVQRFRSKYPQTTLKEVQFVIFPKDVDLYKGFERFQEKLKKDILQEQDKCLPQCTVKINIFGMPENVRKAKEELEAKAQDVLVSVDDSLTEVIPNVSSTVYSALRELLKKVFEGFIKDGIKIHHNESKNEIIVHGKGERFAFTFKTVKDTLEKVQEMHRREVNISNLNEKKIKKVLPDGFYWQENVCCVYNKHNSSITLFASTKNELDKAMKELQKKLGLSSKDLSAPVVLDKELSQRVEKETDIPKSCLMSAESGAASEKPPVRRTFSWSEDASNIDVYERGNFVIRVYEANILHIPVDAIVNAANQDLQHCGGIARAIAKAAGDPLLRECESAILQNNGSLSVSSVVRTTAGNLGFKCVLHAVGPCWSDYTQHSNAGIDQCCEDLKQTIINCFLEADKFKLASIGMPTISSGVFKVPKEACAVQYANAILEYSKKNTTLCEVHIVDLNSGMIDIIHKTFSAMIKEGKPPPPLSVDMDKPGKDTGIDHTKMGQNETVKCTDQSKPRSLTKNDNQCTNVTNYKSDKNRLVCTFSSSATEEDDCVICMDKVTDCVTLKCGHMYCRECIDGYFKVKKVCPTCGQVCGIITGDQPNGTMEIVKMQQLTLSGFDRHSSFRITYHFTGGLQGPEHPRPGTPYKGITRAAYLPDNKEGREVCAMLKVAFERRLVFTIGTSRTTGKEGVITWNDIHHKTDSRPNTQFGYPDDTYLQRVREEMEVKGVTLEDVDNTFMKQLAKGIFREISVDA